MTSTLTRWLAALIVWSAVLLSLLLRDETPSSVRMARLDVACQGAPLD